MRKTVAEVNPKMIDRVSPANRPPQPPPGFDNGTRELFVEFGIFMKFFALPREITRREIKGREMRERCVPLGTPTKKHPAKRKPPFRVFMPRFVRQSG